MDFRVPIYATIRNSSCGAGAGLTGISNRPVSIRNLASEAASLCLGILLLSIWQPFFADFFPRLRGFQLQKTAKGSMGNGRFLLWEIRSIGLPGAQRRVHASAEGFRGGGRWRRRRRSRGRRRSSAPRRACGVSGSGRGRSDRGPGSSRNGRERRPRCRRDSG